MVNNIKALNQGETLTNTSTFRIFQSNINDAFLDKRCNKAKIKQNVIKNKVEATAITQKEFKKKKQKEISIQKLNKHYNK